MMVSRFVLLLAMASAGAFADCPPTRDSNSASTDDVCVHSGARSDTTAPTATGQDQVDDNDDAYLYTIGSNRNLNLETGAVCVLRAPDGSCLDEDGE